MASVRTETEVAIVPGEVGRPWVAVVGSAPHAAVAMRGLTLRIVDQGDGEAAAAFLLGLGQACLDAAELFQAADSVRRDWWSGLSAARLVAGLRRGGSGGR